MPSSAYKALTVDIWFLVFCFLVFVFLFFFKGKPMLQALLRSDLRNREDF